MYKLEWIRTNWIDNLFALFKRVCGNENTDGDVVSNDAGGCTTSTSSALTSNSHHPITTKIPTTAKVSSNLNSPPRNEIANKTTTSTTSPTTSTQNRENWLTELRTMWNKAKTGLKPAKKSSSKQENTCQKQERLGNEHDWATDINLSDSFT